MAGEEGGGSDPCSVEYHLKFNCKERTRKIWGWSKLVEYPAVRMKLEGREGGVMKISHTQTLYQSHLIE